MSVMARSAQLCLKLFIVYCPADRYTKMQGDPRDGFSSPESNEKGIN